MIGLEPGPLEKAKKVELSVATVVETKTYCYPGMGFELRKKDRNDVSSFLLCRKVLSGLSRPSQKEKNTYLELSF